MIARHAPYALTPFQAALDSLVMRISGSAPTAGELMRAAGDARDILEGIVAGNPPDRTPADVWVGRYDGRSLTVSGPRVTALAGFEEGVLCSLVLDFPTGSFELTAEPGGVRVQLSDAGGAMLAHYRFATDGTVHDELAPPPTAAGFDDLFRPPQSADAVPAPVDAFPVSEPPAEPEKQWFYVADGKAEGPVPESELRVRLAALPDATLVWHEGMADWKSAAEALPPPPQAAPPPPVVQPPPPPPAAVEPQPEPVRWELALKDSAATAGPWRVSGEVRMGRSPECEVTLTDGMASRVHAFVAEQADGFWVRDNHSLNGTEVNGVRVEAPVLLKEGDIVRVGDTELVFRAVGASAVASASPRVEPVTRPLFESPPAAPKPSAPAAPFYPQSVDALFGESSPPPLEQPAPFFAPPQPAAAEPSGGARFCTDCGGRNKGDASFCVHCGRRL